MQNMASLALHLSPSAGTRVSDGNRQKIYIYRLVKICVLLNSCAKELF